ISLPTNEIACPAQSRRKGGDSRSGVTSIAARRTRPSRPGLRSGASSSIALDGAARGGGFETRRRRRGVLLHRPVDSPGLGHSALKRPVELAGFRHPLEEPLVLVGARRGLEQAARAAVQVAEVEPSLL